jgi:hypothetical protein
VHVYIHASNIGPGNLVVGAIVAAKVIDHSGTYSGLPGTRSGEAIIDLSNIHTAITRRDSDKN